MGQRQAGQPAVARGIDRQALVDRAGVGRDGRVGEHDALRRPGRAAGGDHQGVAVVHGLGLAAGPRAARRPGRSPSPGASARAAAARVGGGQPGVEREHRVAPVPHGAERVDERRSGRQVERGESGHGPEATVRPRHERIEGVAMQGLMQDHPLSLTHFFDRAERLFPEKTVVTATATGTRPHDLRRVGRAHPAARRRARRRSASRPTAGWRRSAGTRPATSSCTSRRRAAAGCCTRSTSGCSPSSSPTSPTTPRTRWCSSTARSPSCSGRCSTTFKTVRHVVVMDDGTGDAARRGRARAGAARLRGRCWPRPSRSSSARRGREPGRVDVLHERHHGQPEGRRLQPPVDVAAHHGRHDDRRPRRPRERRHPAGGPDVPRQRLGPRPRRGGVRGRRS